jgi:hypothetical protein
MQSKRYLKINKKYIWNILIYYLFKYIFVLENLMKQIGIKLRYEDHHMFQRVIQKKSFC